MAFWVGVPTLLRRSEPYRKESLYFSARSTCHLFYYLSETALCQEVMLGAVPGTGGLSGDGRIACRGYGARMFWLAVYAWGAIPARIVLRGSLGAARWVRLPV